MKLNTIRLKLNEARLFTQLYHRHSKPLKRHKFTIGAFDKSKYISPIVIEEDLLGLVTVDTCSSHSWSQRRDHIEIRRLVVKDGCKNVASFLLSKAVTACFAMGYKAIITYTQPNETGSSLMALGFQAQKFKARTYKDDTFEGLVQWCLTEDYQKNPDFEFTKTNLNKFNKMVQGHSNRKTGAIQ
tara:strand:+ start:2775 stop:3329 length:555 start_codon:yes stop_codon:yes gene_type:complete